MESIQYTDQEESLQKLEEAYVITKQIDKFATVMDTYGIDALASLLPGAGDAITATLSGAYLLKKANQIELTKKDKRKIVITKIKDTLVGLIPVLGDILDYFYKSNKISLKLFEKKVIELEKNARQKGVSEESIQKLKQELNIVGKYTEKIQKIKSDTKNKTIQTLEKKK